MTKLTTRNTGLATLAEYEQCLDPIAELTVKRDKAQARLDKAILAAREEHTLYSKYRNRIFRLLEMPL